MRFRQLCQKLASRWRITDVSRREAIVDLFGPPLYVLALEFEIFTVLWLADQNVSRSAPGQSLVVTFGPDDVIIPLTVRKRLYGSSVPSFWTRLLLQGKTRHRI